MLFVAGLASAARLTSEEYERKASDYKAAHSKEDFVSKLSDEKVSIHRANRAWEYFEEQLKGGRVVFKDSNVQFMLPPSHTFARFTDLIHTGLADGVEFLFSMGRQVYYGSVNQLPQKAQDHHNDFLHWVFESEAVKTGLYCVIAFIIVNTVIRRFTCGLPSDVAKGASLYDELKAKKAI